MQVLPFAEAFIGIDLAGAERLSSDGHGGGSRHEGRHANWRSNRWHCLRKGSCGASELACLGLEFFQLLLFSPPVFRCCCLEKLIDCQRRDSR